MREAGGRQHLVQTRRTVRGVHSEFKVVVGEGEKIFNGVHSNGIPRAWRLPWSALPQIEESDARKRLGQMQDKYKIIWAQSSQTALNL